MWQPVKPGWRVRRDTWRRTPLCIGLVSRVFFVLRADLTKPFILNADYAAESHSTESD